MNNGKILIIDSGVGGLTYYRAIASLLASLPLNIRLDYLADNQAFPYGSKSTAELKAHLTLLAQSLSHLDNPYDFIVIACNTASIYGYDLFLQFFKKEQIIVTTPNLYIQSHPLDAPFLLMATSATCRAYEKTDDLLLLPADELVAWVEKEQHVLSDVEQSTYLQTFWQQHCSSFLQGTIILGCTHFLHIKSLLQSHIPANIKIVDTIISVAKDLKERITQQRDHFSAGKVSSGTLYLTKYSHQEDEFYYKKIAGEYNFEFSNHGLL